MDIFTSVDVSGAGSSAPHGAAESMHHDPNLERGLSLRKGSTHFVTLATCSLDQWAMDFTGNCERILRSVELARARGARYRVGPELEIPGYGCEDHFLESDTYTHSEEVLIRLLESGATTDMICDFGMPVMHNNVRYNCRVVCLNQKILCIRPKQLLAGDGNYREPRWFARWSKPNRVESHNLSLELFKATGQRSVPFGDVAVCTLDTTFSSETCEELFTPDSPNVRLGLAGIEILSNGSGSHHQLRKLDQRLELIRSATSKNGGVYLYANQMGCDGGRLLYDGCSLIAVNGKIVAMGSQFTIADVEVVTATVDLDAVRSFRGYKASRGVQAALAESVPCVSVNWAMSSGSLHAQPAPSCEPVRIHTPEEEIAFGPAIWLWDYLRRSGASGFFLPLSGGADSSSTATIVGSMCNLVARAARAGDRNVIQDARRIAGEKPDSSYLPLDPKEFANRIMHTAYMGTKNSSAGTRNFAKALAEAIGTYHLSVDIDMVVEAIVKLFALVTGKTPQFKVHGGTPAENLALQNIQARFRMVFAYMLAQLLPWIRGRSGWLLVLGSANVDEGLRGYVRFVFFNFYFGYSIPAPILVEPCKRSRAPNSKSARHPQLTKYDCSSADINPIGGISKADLKRFLWWAAKPENLGYEVLHHIANQPPTAELEPITDEYIQSDEADMGMTYEELTWYGRLRKIELCGPVSMFQRLLVHWPHLKPRQVADKVKFFFEKYTQNRHKMTTLTPSYHAEQYSPEDNRFDLRPFLLDWHWKWQFERLDELLEDIEEEDAVRQVDRDPVRSLLARGAGDVEPDDSRL